MKPCNWPVSYAGCGNPEPTDPPEPLASLPEGVEKFEAMAVDYLWRWTGKTLGTCEVSVELCRDDCTDGRSSFFGSGPHVGGMWRPVIVDGAWTNISCGMCGDRCGCGGAGGLVLPGPVSAVVSVVEDGETLPASGYSLNRNVLYRVGGVWNPCDTVVKYNRGVTVPAGGEIAAGVLALELAKASCNDNTCQLPKRLQTITRQGVTVAMLDSFDDVDKGHTGIWIIDSWVASMTKPKVRPSVLSPDKPRHAARRSTWTT
jgi:hypothetical protein